MHADPQTHSLSYNTNTSLKNDINLDADDMQETPIGLYNLVPPPPESPSWRSLNLTTSRSNTEWDLGSTNPTSPTGSNEEPGWSCQPPTHSDFAFIGGPDGLTGDSSGYAYDYLVGDHHYVQAYRLPSPNETYNLGPQEYHLCIPPELSSLCLDRQHAPSQPVPVPRRHFQWSPSAPNSYPETSFPYITPLSPSSTASPPFAAHMSASTTTPMQTHYGTRNTDGDDGDYIPGVPEFPKTRNLRATTATKRNTNTQYCPSSHHLESFVQRYPCPFPSCSLAFARARDLKRHYRLHSGELPYKCDRCDRGFIRSDARARHWRAQPECGAKC